MEDKDLELLLKTAILMLGIKIDAAKTYEMQKNEQERKSIASLIGVIQCNREELSIDLDLQFSLYKKQFKEYFYD